MPPPTFTTSVSPRMMLHGLDRHGDQVRDHLRKAGLVALAGRLRADDDVDVAVGTQPLMPRLLLGRTDRGLNVVREPEAEKLAALALPRACAA